MAAGRIVYALTLALLGAVEFYSGSPMVLLCMGVLALLGIAMAVCLLRDGRGMTIACEMSAHGEVGAPLRVRLLVGNTRRMLAAKTLLVELETTNAMTGEKKTVSMAVPLGHQAGASGLTLTPEDCGELTVCCAQAVIQDHLELFNRKIPGFDPVKTMIYPQKVLLDVLLAPNSSGAPREGGPMQNKRGNDQSEVFELREYVPGDDIRSIHWKLSVKADELILRQPGAPTYYDLVVLADMGLLMNGEPVDKEELGAAIAYGAAALENLTRQGIRCCLALPTGAGIQLFPVSNREECQDVLGRWLRLRLPQNAGDAMKLFRLEHLDDHFSRVLALTAGKLTPQRELTGLRSSITVLSAAEGAAEGSITVGTVRYAELPAPPNRDARCRVLC